MKIHNKVDLFEIKDLRHIYFYDLFDGALKNNKKTYFGLKIVFDNDKTLDLDYTNEFFAEYVLRVLSVYKRERHLNNITFIDDSTKDYLDNLILEYGKKSFDDKLQKAIFIPSINRSFAVNLFNEYLKDGIKLILKLFYSENSIINIDNISGYRDKYIVNYSVNGINDIFPLICFKTGETELSFKISGIEGIGDPISGDIALTPNILITWNNDDEEIYGKLYYNLEEKYSEKVIRNENKAVFVETKELSISPDKQKLCEFYINLLLGFKTEGFDITQTVNDSYLYGYKNSTITEDENNILNTKSGHIKICKNLVYIISSDRYGISIHGDDIVIPYLDDKQEIILFPFDFEGENYILLQRKYISGSKTIGEHKDKHLNVYSYEIFKVENNKDLTNEIKVIDNFKIQEEISDLSGVEEIIKRRRL